ncbi:hypothetical protein V8F06_005482 [Rhypophila decipiens]
MDLQQPPMFGFAAVVVGLLVLYLYRTNQAWKYVPQEHQPGEWTVDQIKETYERLKRNPVDFTKLVPPRLGRRYVVVGGSGLVGGDIVLQLLARGESASSIRIVDFQPVTRHKMLQNGAGACDYVKADISSIPSVEAAFSRPWPKAVAERPMTVFHTAASIRPAERKWIFYDRLRKVNVVGVANVLDVCRKHGADIFVYTSSASVGLWPLRVWNWPWQKCPKNHVQVYNEDDFDKPLRPHNEYFSNYAYSKAESERLVSGANSQSFRTGIIRPGNGIYGGPADVVMGLTVEVAKQGPVTSWSPHIIQNFVASRNVSLGHLLFEAALAPPPNSSNPKEEFKPPPCAGRPYIITDPGLITFQSMYTLMSTISIIKPFEFTYPPPVILFIFAEMIEAWCTLLYYTPGFIRNLPVLNKILIEPTNLLTNLQPAIFTPTSHTICDDSRARRSVADGGLGYKSGIESSLEGMVELMIESNEHEERELRKLQEGNGSAIGKEKGIKEKIEEVVLPRPEPVGA